MKKNLDRLGGLIHSQRVLLALTQGGVSREEAYALVQRNAMPVWRGEGDFLTLLKNDKDVRKVLGTDELEELFDQMCIRDSISDICMHHLTMRTISL